MRASFVLSCVILGQVHGALCAAKAETITLAEPAANGGFGEKVLAGSEYD